MGHISRTDLNRWFLIQSLVSGEPGIIVFGICPVDRILDTGQPNLVTYLTEDELEIEVDDVAGIPNYYKDAVESSNYKFQGTSGKYSPPEE